MPATLTKRFAHVDAIVREAIGVRATAAVARIEYEGVPLYEASYGMTRADAAGVPISPDSRFDLASLTKVFVAALALAQISAQLYDLDRSLVKFFPEWRGTSHEALTARMLLAHTGGFASGADYRTLFDSDVEKFALSTPLVATPAQRVIYSDLGFIALGTLVARAARCGLAECAREVFARLQLEATGFRPLAATHSAIAATEQDGWRGRVQGFVHDEKAFLMGGVSGHAGLFGTARDVARLTELFLGNRRRRQPALIAPELLGAAVEEQAYDPVLRRGLGWALKTSEENSCGVLMSATTFGHTGFTGTCVWADPERDLSIVLLTNAVYYGRSDIRALRAAVCDAAVEDLRLR